VTNNTAGTVSVLLRQAGGGFAPDAGTPITAPAANGIGTADFNGDGRPDLAVSDRGTTLTVLLNTTAPATATPAPAPPVAGRSVVVRVVSGTVRIERAGQRYVTLTDAANIPVGSLVDARKGRVALTSAADTGGKKLQTAQFYDGIFQIKQSVPGRAQEGEGAHHRPPAPRRDRALAVRAAQAHALGRRRQEEGPQGRARQAVGQRQGHVPHDGQVQLRDGPRHDLAHAGRMRRHADQGPPWRRQRARLQTQEDPEHFQEPS
jgi:FG-GAP repeat